MDGRLVAGGDWVFATGSIERVVRGDLIARRLAPSALLRPKGRVALLDLRPHPAEEDDQEGRDRPRQAPRLGAGDAMLTITNLRAFTALLDGGSGEFEGAVKSRNSQRHCGK